jgi:ESF2/ABP1 family protein
MDNRFDTSKFSLTQADTYHSDSLNSHASESTSENNLSELEEDDDLDASQSSSNDEEEEEDFNEKLEKISQNAKPLSLELLKKFQKQVDSTGVCYLSSIPPFMKPTKLRSLLAKYGKLGRIYLSPEDPKISARRKKYKHNKRIHYTEGWVEFLDKKVARSTADLLKILEEKNVLIIMMIFGILNIYPDSNGII